MESEKGEQKLNSNEVVVSMVSIEDDNTKTHIKPQPKEVHRLKSHMHVPNDSSSIIHKSSASSTLNKPSKTPSESSLPPQTNSKTKQKSVRTTSMVEKVPKDPQREEDGDEDDDEEEIDDGGVYGNENAKHKHKKNEKWEIMYILEFTFCSCILVVCITSLFVKEMRHDKPWGLEIWRWCVLLLVIFCGRLLTAAFTNVLVFVIERKFLRKNKVLYFIHSLKRCVQVFLWLAFVLLTWVILIRKRLREPKHTTEVLRHITRFLVSSIFGAGLWIIKTLLVKILACSFHVKRFFDRIQDSIFHQYVLLTLSEPRMRKNQRLASKTKFVLILQKLMKGNIVEKQIIDVEKLRKMIKETVSAWTITGLVNVIEGSGLATISSVLDESVDITNEDDAERAGNHIFINVARAVGHSRFIDEADLLLFLPKEDVDKVFNMFKCSPDSRKIKRTTMREWVVKVYKERELLAQSIKDAKTAIEGMNKILSGMALIVIIVVWLILMRLATTEMLIFISTQILLAAFIFGDSCKNGFDCIIYIFVMHPYDVGDHCVIDGVQMVVEEMNILTTVFKNGKETIIYPNSVLATIPIKNFYRDADLPEYVEFVIDVSTPEDTIAKLKDKIKAYIEKKDKQWYPRHKFKEIKNGNKLKIVLSVNPVTKVQDYWENSTRRPELLSKIKEIFEELEIKYHHLPQEVHLNNMGSDTQ